MSDQTAPRLSPNAPRRILVVGPSGAGKDTACQYLARITLLRFAGTTSDYLARHVAARLGISLEQAYRSRHANRNVWHRVGNHLRKHDPGLLVRESLEHAEITGGVRGIEEIQACRREHLVDLIVWIDNPRVRAGSTTRLATRTAMSSWRTMPGWKNSSSVCCDWHALPGCP